jgi:hypothetical protein
MDIPSLQAHDISKVYTDYIKYETSKKLSSDTSSINPHTEFSFSLEGKKKQLIDQLISKVVRQLVAGALSGRK